jgi:hypothetical protein
VLPNHRSVASEHPAQPLAGRDYLAGKRRMLQLRLLAAM